MRFGEKLRKLRSEQGLTQGELAEKAGLGKNTINNYEKGRTYPQDRSVYQTLASILGVPVDALRNENDDFIAEAQARYGYRGRKQAEALADELGVLFAGGEMSDEDLDAVIHTLQDYYWKAKEDNKKYGRRAPSQD